MSSGNKFLALTLDLEPDYGYAGQYRIFENPQKIEEVLKVLDSFGVKTTVFAVGEIFELYPHIIRLFEKYGCEFEVHSYSPDLADPEPEEEIKKSKAAFRNYFKKDPRGYRVPQGRVSDVHIRLLEKHGFLYDSSIFPSYFPNPFRYLFCDKNIHTLKNSNLVEIPLASITPFRLTLSLSYLKLLGMKFYLKLFQVFGIPKTVVFNTHLHDFIFCEESYNRVSSFWKFVWGRNKLSGTDYCVRFLEEIRKRGYKFCFLSELYNQYADTQSRIG